MRNFQCALLRVCADDGESQTLLIISALIRVTALENVLEGLQMAHSTLHHLLRKAVIQEYCSADTTSA